MVSLPMREEKPPGILIRGACWRSVRKDIGCAMLDRGSPQLRGKDPRVPVDSGPSSCCFSRGREPSACRDKNYGTYPAIIAGEDPMRY
ncbi:MAG: hypothetical protein JWP89_4960 [Schlesneria sp.]|nr:hypothetical protein [Schlesneria sp.]